jgi:hypothetical protein
MRWWLTNATISLLSHQMKKILFVIVLLFPIYATIFAQHIQIDWQNCFNGPKADYAYGICSTGDGYFITGNYEHPTDVPPEYGQHDVWLIKTDLFGNYLWDKKFGSNEIADDGGINVFPSGDGNFYIVGGALASEGDISDDPYPGSVDYWIVKIDGDGIILWDKIVGGNCGDEPWAGTPTSDGGLVAVGLTCSDDGDVSQYFGFYDLWAVKLNSSGQKQWDFTLGTLGHEGGIAMIETSDHGFLIGGTSMSEGDGNYSCIPHSYGSEALVAKLDSNGVLLWDKCYGGSDYDYAFSVLEIEEGYMIAGISLSNDGDVLDSGWHGMEDIWLFKIDFDGNILWQKCYGGSGSEIPQKIFRTEDGGYMVIGYTNSHDGDVVGNISVGEFNDIWMFKIDASGALLWQSCIGSQGNETMQSTAIQMSNVNYVIAANIFPLIDGDVACPPPVEYNPGIWFFEITDTTVSVPESKQLIKLKVFPNPATNWLSVEIPAFINDKHSLLQIVDINGKTLLEQTPVSSKTHLNVAHLPAGIYVLKLMYDGTFVTKRFIIR